METGTITITSDELRMIRMALCAESQREKERVILFTDWPKSDSDQEWVKAQKDKAIQCLDSINALLKKLPCFIR